jgi:hypothetical protein
MSGGRMGTASITSNQHQSPSLFAPYEEHRCRTALGDETAGSKTPNEVQSRRRVMSSRGTKTACYAGPLGSFAAQEKELL